MSLMDIVHSLCIYLPVFVGLYVIAQHLLYKLKNYPPTPFFNLPILGHLYLIKKPLQGTILNLSNLYGPVLFLRLGSRPVLLVASASVAEECLTKNDIIFANRPQLLFGKYLGYDFTSIVWGPYGDHWRNLRRIASIEVVTSQKLQKISEICADEVQKMIGTLLRACTDNYKYQSLQLKPVFYKLMFNVMTRMMAGKRYFSEDASMSAEAKKFLEMVNETSLLAGSSNLGDFMPILRWFLFPGTKNRFKALNKKREELMQNWIQEFRNTRSESKDKTMVESLLSMQQREPEFTDLEIRSLILALIQAGVSQTVDTMEWTMTFLVNNPEVLKKSKDEIDNHIGLNNRLVIDEADVGELPYLQCIINETLRKRPVAPFLIPHESSGDCTIAGFHVPRKTMLLVNLGAIQNDPNLWTDPEKFMPERFEGFDDDAKAEFKWMPFGSGRRGCPGKKLAMRILGFTIGSLIQCFDWDRMGEEMVDLTQGGGLNAPKAQPLMAKYRPHPNMIDLLSQI